MDKTIERILLISWEHSKGLFGDEGHGHIWLDFHHLHEDGTPRNFSFNRFDIKDAGDAMSELRIRSQMNIRPKEDGSEFTTDDLYSWEVYYQRPFHVGLVQARAMAKTLNKINRYLDKQTEKWHHPNTFTEYVQRVAYCMKIKSILQRTDDDPILSTYSNMEYRSWPIGDAHYAISTVFHDNITPFQKIALARTLPA